MTGAGIWDGIDRLIAMFENPTVGLPNTSENSPRLDSSIGGTPQGK